MAKFCGYVHGYIYGDGQILWVWNFDLWKILLGMWCWFLENLNGYDFGYVRTYLCMSLWEFLSWSCRNFFFFHGYGKFLVVVYRYVKNFDCGKIWQWWHFGGALIFFYGGGALVVRIFFWVWNFLVMWVLVMKIDELNFSVAESQELRQSPNVEKCMGTIVS